MWNEGKNIVCPLWVSCAQCLQTSIEQTSTLERRIDHNPPQPCERLTKAFRNYYWDLLLLNKALQDFKSNCDFRSVTALASKETLEYYFPVLLQPPFFLISIVSCQQYDLISESILCRLNGAWFKTQCTMWCFKLSVMCIDNDVLMFPSKRTFSHRYLHFLHHL